MPCSDIRVVQANVMLQFRSQLPTVVLQQGEGTHQSLSSVLAGMCSERGMPRNAVSVEVKEPAPEPGHEGGHEWDSPQWTQGSQAGSLLPALTALEVQTVAKRSAQTE